MLTTMTALLLYIATYSFIDKHNSLLIIFRHIVATPVSLILQSIFFLHPPKEKLTMRSIHRREKNASSQRAGSMLAVCRVCKLSHRYLYLILFCNQIKTHLSHAHRCSKLCMMCTSPRRGCRLTKNLVRLLKKKRMLR